jgi:hypothetical protein
MFVVTSTTFGIGQRLLAYAQLSDALARASLATATATDKAEIVRVAGDGDAGAAVSAVGSGGGVYVGAVSNASPAAMQSASDAAKAQIFAAMTPALLERDAGKP